MGEACGLRYKALGKSSVSIEKGGHLAKTAELEKAVKKQRHCIGEKNVRT